MEEPYVFSFYFKMVLSDTQVKAEVQRKHELNDPVRFRCEQAKGTTGQVFIRPHTGACQPILQACWGNRTVTNFTAAESQQSSNNLVLHRGLKTESGTTLS